MIPATNKKERKENIQFMAGNAVGCFFSGKMILSLYKIWHMYKYNILYYHLLDSQSLPTISRDSTRLTGGNNPMAEIQLSTPQKRKLRSNSTPSPMQSSSAKWKSPRRCVKDCPKSHVKVTLYVFKMHLLTGLVDSYFLILNILLRCRGILGIKQ